MALLIAFIISSLFLFLYWKVTHASVKNEYGTKVWNHWPSKLYYWQAAVMYSLGLTIGVMYLLKWSGILQF